MTAAEDGPKRWKAAGTLTAILAPGLLVLGSNGPVKNAVSGALNDSFADRIKSAQGDPRLINYIQSQIEPLALDRTLVIYLVVAGLVGLIGAVHRVWANGGDSKALKSADFAGKCLALSAAMIVGSAAWARLVGAQLNDYMPDYFWVFVWVAIVVFTGVFWWLWFLHVKAKIKAKEKAEAKAKAKAKAEEKAKLGAAVVNVSIAIVSGSFGMLWQPAKAKARARAKAEVQSAAGES